MGLFSRLAEAWSRRRAESESKRREAAAQWTAAQEELEQAYKQGVRRRARARILNPPADTWVPTDTVRQLFGYLLDPPVGFSDPGPAYNKLSAAARRELSNGRKPKTINDDLVASGFPEDQAPGMVNIIVEGYNELRRLGLSYKDIREKAEHDLLPQNNDVVLKHVGTNKINVIKVVRELTDLTVKEANELVEAAPKAIMVGVARDVAKAAARSRAAWSSLLLPKSLHPNSKALRASPAALRPRGWYWGPYVLSAYSMDSL